VGFLRVKVRYTWVDSWIGGQRFRYRPEDVVVVWEVGEEDTKEEACCCYRRLASPLGYHARRIVLQPTIRKVAKGPTPFRAIVTAMCALLE
jgi:hypothetical protein